MNREQLTETLAQHRLWLCGEGGSRAYLRGADLRDADMRDADLRDAYLSDAYLSGADMRGADLRDADMRGAYLSDAYLSGADMRGADMRGANMRGANMRGANMRGANLSDADMRGASIWGTIGNMREIKSAQFDKWPVSWMQSPDGVTILQIGCKRHDLALWEKSDPRWISALDDGATAWWAQYRDVVLALVKASPAVPYGKAKEE